MVVNLVELHKQAIDFCFPTQTTTNSMQLTVKCRKACVIMIGKYQQAHGLDHPSSTMYIHRS